MLRGSFACCDQVTCKFCPASTDDHHSCSTIRAMAQPARKEKLSAADREKLLREEHYVLRVQDTALASSLRKELQRAPADSHQPVELTITFDGSPYRTRCTCSLQLLHGSLPCGSKKSRPNMCRCSCGRRS